MPSRVVSFITVILSLLIAGCEEQTPRSMPVPQVTTITIAPEPVTLTTELAGRTSAFLVAEIRPQVNGIIQKRLFTEGSQVKAGQTLYQINPAPFEAALSSAKASLAKAQAGTASVEARAERYRDLLADNAISQQDYDDATAALLQAKADIQFCQASVQTAQINLEYTKVSAPISGRIGKSSVTDGALVTAYQPLQLATIQQLDPIYVDVPQSTSELLRLKRKLQNGYLHADANSHSKVKLVLEDGTPYPHQGQLQFQDVTVDPTTGSVILRIVFPNPDGVLLPGMFVRAEIIEGINEQAVLLPQQGITRSPKGQPLALIVNDQNIVEQRQVTIDRAVGDKWLVTSGLIPGEKVIVEGFQKIRPGMPVKVTGDDAGENSAAPKTTQLGENTK